VGSTEANVPLGHIKRRLLTLCSGVSESGKFNFNQDLATMNVLRVCIFAYGYAVGICIRRGLHVVRTIEGGLPEP